MINQCCASCKFFNTDMHEDPEWGMCEVPLPDWVWEQMPYPSAEMKDSYGVECAAWKKRTDSILLTNVYNPNDR